MTVVMTTALTSVARRTLFMGRHETRSHRQVR
jgi:hypothetical protein